MEKIRMAATTTRLAKGVLDLPFDQGQAGDQPQGGHILGGIGHQIARRHDHLAGLGAVHRHAQPVGGVLRLHKVQVIYDAVGIGAAGGMQ